MSVGLDIGSKTLKVVELSSSGNTFNLKSAGVVGYNGATVEHIESESEFVSLSDLLRKLFRDSGISTKQITIGLPESQVFTRIIKFPLLTDQEIASAVKWEAERYIPIPLAEAIVQHQILERRENSSPPEVIVLLVAAPRALSEKYIKLINMAGLNAIAIETELIALVRALAPSNQTVIIVDFGARSSNLAIARNSALVFSRTIPTAGDVFTRAVAQSLGISPQQAEEYKRTYGLSTSQLEAKVKTAIDPVFRIVIDEIKKAIHFYQSEEKGEAPTSLILSGGTAGLPEIVSYLSSLLGIEVMIANPFSKLSVDPSVLRNLAAYSPLYSVAVGFALRQG